MNYSIKKKERIVGLFLFVGIVTGIFSIAPAIDSIDYLKEAALNSNQVIIAAIFQFAMSLIYLGIAVLLYPIVKPYSKTLSLGFLSFRIIAVTLSIAGTILMLTVLSLSKDYVGSNTEYILMIQTLADVLKSSRDVVNHIFMILILCSGNIMLYILFIKSKLIPNWVSYWGIIGAILSIIASGLVLFDILGIITFDYILLNTPTAILDLILSAWLIFKGFNKRASL
ncbi:protein of unknown function [Marivirga sericea]|uniref:DUF4386 domain-containing protein n=1 Tax=Marivirga sericea TaxID=1028 RepID=A0A1X7JMH5_9BACT|nr:DUF4386 domain-containing protein [Marivirga sericea]SMG29075.1 protein of unknown function [Marivirga sericea]